MIPYDSTSTLHHKSLQLGGNLQGPHWVLEQLLKLLSSATAALMDSNNSSADVLPGRVRTAQLGNLPWVKVACWETCAHSPLGSLVPAPSLVANGHVSSTFGTC